jgi:4-amino-4-deoxy-L-arabinose transferase-like glycosyltransferase
MVQLSSLFPSFNRRRYGLLLLCFAAYLLRLFHLDAQSFWYDEGFSAWLAVQPFDQIIARTSADIHPPLYYFALRVWLWLVGQSEFALRFLSLAPSVLTIPVLFALTRRIFDGLTGWIVAVCAILSPAYLWYAQEARMYAWLVFLTALSSHFLLRWLDQEHWRDWFALTLCNVLAVYLHFFAFFIVAFQVCYFIVWWTRQETRWLIFLAGLGSATLVVTAYSPWFRFVLNRLNADPSYFDGTLPIGEVIRKTFVLFTVGHSWLEGDGILAALVFVGLAFIGWFAASRIRADLLTMHDDNPFRVGLTATAAARWFLFFYLFVPFIMLYLVSYARPKFHPRYLLIVSPPFYILIAVCLAALALGFWRNRHGSARRRYVALVGAAVFATLVLSVWASATSNLYFDPRFLKDDFRSAIALIKAQRQPNEPTLLVSGHLYPIYQYYDPQGPYIPLPDEPTINVNRVLNYTVANDLNATLRGKTGAWVLLWQDEIVDPNGFVKALLDTQAKPLPQPNEFHGVELLHYQIPPNTVFSDKPPIQKALGANFSKQIELMGYSVPATPSPSDKGLELTLFWRVLDNLTKDYNVALRVLDDDGHLVGKYDGRPGNYNFPTFRWKAGDVLFGQFVIPLELGTPPGAYQVEIVLYEALKDRALNLDVLDAAGNPAGQFVTTQPISITRATKQPKVEELKLQQPRRFDFGRQIEMLGFFLDRESAEPGDPINVTIYWRALTNPRQEYQLQFKLLRTADDSREPTVQMPLLPHLPTSQWRQGDVIRAQYTYYVPLDARASERTLSLGLLDATGKALSAFTSLGELRINASTRGFIAPNISRLNTLVPPSGTLSNVVALYGYETLPVAVTNTRNAPPMVLSGPGQNFRLTLHWRVLQRMKTSYTVFVQVRRDGGPIVAQRDAIPVNGARPTTTWVPGEYIADVYELGVRSDAPRADYFIEVGMYDARTGQRLLLSSGARPLDAIRLNMGVSVR